MQQGMLLHNGPVRSQPAPPPYRSHVNWLKAQDFHAADNFWRELLNGFSAPTPLVAHLHS